MSRTGTRAPQKKAKSYEDFLAELDSALAEHRATYTRLGSILLEAKWL